MGSQYCTAQWNDHGQTPSGESPPQAYGQFLTIYAKIRIYEIPQTGPGSHPAFTCALIAATRLDQISDVYANTFDGRGWVLDQTDAHAMQMNGVVSIYPPNATITASGQVRLGTASGGKTSVSPVTSHPGTTVSTTSGPMSCGIITTDSGARMHVRVSGGVSCAPGRDRAQPLV